MLSSKRAVLVAPAEGISPETVNEVITIAKGLTFVAISQERAQSFFLSPMKREAISSPTFEEQFQQYTSVEAREGITTGISAADRATTLRVLGEEHPYPSKLVKPGHIFPVMVKAGGVLARPGLPEAALDIAILSGKTDAALFVDLLNREGNLASPSEQDDFAQRYNIPILHLSDLVRFRLDSEKLVERVAEARLPSRQAGEILSVLYHSPIHPGDHMALVKGALDPKKPILVRVQRESSVEDIIGSWPRSSRNNLQASLQAIGARGSGILVYLRAPVTIPGSITDQQRNVTMMRDYGLGAQILRDLGVKKIELLTNTSRILSGLTVFGLEIVAQHRIPDLQHPNEDNLV